MKTAFKSDSDRSVLAVRSTTVPGDRTGLIVACLYAAFAIGLVCLAVTTARADSIWPTNGQSPRGMFADRKAGFAGDIITIVVSESVAAQNSQSKSSNRESSMEDAIQKFIFSGLAAHRGEMPGLSLSGKSNYSGGGETSNSQSLSSRAAVLVTDVLPNGNLVIEGVRVVRFSGETQYVVLHGLVRPDDIARDNTVISSNIADARVEFYAEGALTDAQKRGWLAKAYEKLRPF